MVVDIVCFPKYPALLNSDRKFTPHHPDHFDVITQVWWHWSKDLFIFSLSLDVRVLFHSFRDMRFRLCISLGPHTTVLTRVWFIYVMMLWRWEAAPSLIQLQTSVFLYLDTYLHWQVSHRYPSSSREFSRHQAIWKSGYRWPSFIKLSFLKWQKWQNIQRLSSKTKPQVPSPKSHHKPPDPQTPTPQESFPSPIYFFSTIASSYPPSSEYG